MGLSTVVGGVAETGAVRMGSGMVVVCGGEVGVVKADVPYKTERK